MQHTIKDTAFHNQLDLVEFEKFCKENMQKYGLTVEGKHIITTTATNVRLIEDFKESQKPGIIYFNEICLTDNWTKKIANKILAARKRIFLTNKHK